jgi:hypothetical protein
VFICCSINFTNIFDKYPEYFAFLASFAVYVFVHRKERKVRKDITYYGLRFVVNLQFLTV